jgi:hypothetical protein
VGVGVTVGLLLALLPVLGPDYMTAARDEVCGAIPSREADCSIFIPFKIWVLLNSSHTT